MKIGILTYHRAHNYGAMLQAYALLSCLRNNGHDVEIIDYWPDAHRLQYALIKPIVGNGILSKIKCIIANAITFIRRYIRIRKFENFSHKYLNIGSVIQYTNPNNQINDQYDCVIVGSDQIWRNKESNGKHIEFDAVYFGQNIPKNIRCISYAASMGIIDLTEHDIATLLLTQEAWGALLPTSPYRKKQYVLYYELIPSPSALAFAQEQANAMQCDLLVMDAVIHTIPRFGHISTASPIEFLHAIRDAKYIVATSFHGTAFSIIFEKQFITIGLHTNADRVKTLLKHLHIEDHYHPTPTMAPTIDYAIINPFLADMRKQSLQLLTSAINYSSKEK